jgi:hypothetical protein
VPCLAFIAVAIDAHTRGDGVGEHVFELALAFCDFADLNARSGCHSLIGAGLEELAYPDAAGVPGGAAGGKDVIGADALVAIGNGGLFADEE